MRLADHSPIPKGPPKQQAERRQTRGDETSRRRPDPFAEHGMQHGRHSPLPQDLVDSLSTLPYGVPTVYHCRSPSLRETPAASASASASPPGRPHDGEKSSLRTSLIRMASKTTPCQLVETASAARHGTRLMRPDGQSLLSLWPSDSVGNPSLRTTTPRDVVHSLRYTNVVGLGRWIVIPGGRNGAVTTAHQDNNRGCDPPNWAATDKSLRKHNGNGRGWRAAELLLLCHCVSRGVCPFMRSSTKMPLLCK